MFRYLVFHITWLLSYNKRRFFANKRHGGSWNFRALNSL